MYIRAQIAHETFWRQQKKQTQDKQRKMNKIKKKHRQNKNVIEPKSK